MHLKGFNLIKEKSQNELERGDQINNGWISHPIITNKQTWNYRHMPMWKKWQVLQNKHDKLSRSPGPSCIFWPLESFKVHCFGLGQAEQQDKLGTHMAICLYSSILWYRSCRLCWLYVVFALCTCLKRFFTMCTIIPFLVLISNTYFLLFLILLVTFEVSSH